MVKRTIIEIDDSKCDGCGLCIPNCPEGALQIIDNKVRLVSDLFCDGLGACMGNCPKGALRTVVRESEPYDERKAMENIVTKGAATILAHLVHLQSHGEKKLLAEAIDFLKEHQLPIPELPPVNVSFKCPGMKFQKREITNTNYVESTSALQQWPIQLKLINPNASFFENSELLISADCVAYAYGAFHNDLLQNKRLIIFCPKLDTEIEEYTQKLIQIFQNFTIPKITIVRMEVPCCGGTVQIVKKALQEVSQSIPVEIKIIGTDGKIQTSDVLP